MPTHGPTNISTGPLMGRLRARDHHGGAPPGRNATGAPGGRGAGKSGTSEISRGPTSTQSRLDLQYRQRPATTSAGYGANTGTAIEKARDTLAEREAPA